MKPVVKYFLTITAGIMLGYAWAAHVYLPKIHAHKEALKTYQEYFLAKEKENQP